MLVKMDIAHILLIITSSLIQYCIVLIFMYNLITFNIITFIENHWYAVIPMVIILITNLQILFKSILYNYLVTDYTKVLYKEFFDRIHNNNTKDVVKVLDIGVGTGYAAG